jgi:hypothetical protein
MRDKVFWSLFLVLMVLLVGGVAYQAITFYTYPCKAYQSGLLSHGYAPARCIQ